MSQFSKDLKVLLNKCSVENESNTPDFILAEYLLACLNAWNNATLQREHWYGCTHEPLKVKDAP